MGIVSYMGICLALIGVFVGFDDPYMWTAAAAMIGAQYLVPYEGPSGPQPQTPYNPRELTPMEALNEEFLTTDMDSIDYVLKADKL